MNLTTTLIFYLIVGGGVAGAVHLADNTTSFEHWFRAATAIVFWPLYVPVLLQSRRSVAANELESDLAESSPNRPELLTDEVAIAIRQVE